MKSFLNAICAKESLSRRVAGWPFTGIGWAIFGVGCVLLFVGGCFFQLGGDIAGERDEL